MSAKWHWVYNLKGGKFYDVGILPDGSLHNPNGYDEADVRAACIAAEERRAARRKEAAKKASVTRALRRERRIAMLAKQWLRGIGVGRQTRCCICRKQLADEASITRGVGSECWDVLQNAIARAKEAA
jgi:hypothetical protein